MPGTESYDSREVFPEEVGRRELHRIIGVFEDMALDEQVDVILLDKITSKHNCTGWRTCLSYQPFLRDISEK